ncbi:MAG: hypothetical protein JXA99_03395 [Candidatus Lokiarchaeota archaeon]|nr:hypothetical protein [Candidatus Lokiarchaeota archaeon]
MFINEVGIIIGGVPTITVNYNNPSEEELDSINKCALLSCILNFAEILISPVESFESNNYTFAFKKDKIIGVEEEETELHAYFIMKRYKKFNKDLNSKIIPVLERIIKKFKEKYKNRDFSYSTQFIDFREDINKIIGISSMNIEQKVELLFFG